MEFWLVVVSGALFVSVAWNVFLRFQVHFAAQEMKQHAEDWRKQTNALKELTETAAKERAKYKEVYEAAAKLDADYIALRKKVSESILGLAQAAQVRN